MSHRLKGAAPLDGFTPMGCAPHGTRVLPMPIVRSSRVAVLPASVTRTGCAPPNNQIFQRIISVLIHQGIKDLAIQVVIEVSWHHQVVLDQHHRDLLSYSY